MAATACTPDVVSPPSQAVSSDHTASTDHASPVTAYANEPAGFTRLLQNSATALPAVLQYTALNPAGFWRMNPSPNTKLITTSAAPCSPPGVWSATYPAGFKAGSGPVTLWAQGASTGTVPEARRWYMRSCIKVGRAGGYENQTYGTKMGSSVWAVLRATERVLWFPSSRGMVFSSGEVQLVCPSSVRMRRDTALDEVRTAQ
jgi:hypothetical protein